MRALLTLLTLLVIASRLPAAAALGVAEASLRAALPAGFSEGHRGTAAWCVCRHGRAGFSKRSTGNCIQAHTHTNTRACVRIKVDSHDASSNSFCWSNDKCEWGRVRRLSRDNRRPHLCSRPLHAALQRCYVSRATAQRALLKARTPLLSLQPQDHGRRRVHAHVRNARADERGADDCGHR